MRLPDRPDLDHLKRQAKDLHASARRGDPQALARFRDRLPATAGRPDGAIAALGLRLHDAQSCLAREYGFPSWHELRSFVLVRRSRTSDRAAATYEWLRLVYAGDITGGTGRASPAAAARLLESEPGLAEGDPSLACAVGDEAALRRAIEADPGWIGRADGPLGLPPLVAVAHSSLLTQPVYRERLIGCTRLLLDRGADPDQKIRSRWRAAAGEPAVPSPLSALYGAAGQNRDPELTRMLLAAGADPNDGESLYHALEDIRCTRLLLEAGARIAGTNALYRVLDLDDVEALRLLLAYGADQDEPPGGEPTDAYGTPLLWAIRRRRSRAHVAALLEAGADPGARTRDGTGAFALALRFGLPEVAELLAKAGATEAIGEADRFVAACAAGDAATASALRARHPDLPESLPEAQLRQLPEMAALGCGEAVRLMVRLGWPLATRGGDWDASALNHAVFRGDAGLARFLLEQGASWRERHGFGDHVAGTLSWASTNESQGAGNQFGDWVGCAEALLDYGMPGGRRDPAGSDAVILDGTPRRFSDEVSDILLAHPDR